MTKRKFYTHEERKQIAMEEFEKAMIRNGQTSASTRRRFIYIGLEFLNYYRLAGQIKYQEKRKK